MKDKNHSDWQLNDPMVHAKGGLHSHLNKKKETGSAIDFIRSQVWMSSIHRKR